MLRQSVRSLINLLLVHCVPFTPALLESPHRPQDLTRLTPGLLPKHRQEHDPSAGSDPIRDPYVFNAQAEPQLSQLPAELPSERFPEKRAVLRQQFHVMTHPGELLGRQFVNPELHLGLKLDCTPIHTRNAIDRHSPHMPRHARTTVRMLTSRPFMQPSPPCPPPNPS